MVWFFFFFLHWIQAIGQMKTNKQAQISDVLSKEIGFVYVCLSVKQWQENLILHWKYFQTSSVCYNSEHYLG